MCFDRSAFPQWRLTAASGTLRSDVRRRNRSTPHKGRGQLRRHDVTSRALRGSRNGRPMEPAEAFPLGVPASGGPQGTHRGSSQSTRSAATERQRIYENESLSPAQGRVEKTCHILAGPRLAAAVAVWARSATLGELVRPSPGLLEAHNLLVACRRFDPEALVPAAPDRHGADGHMDDLSTHRDSCMRPSSRARAANDATLGLCPLGA